MKKKTIPLLLSCLLFSSLIFAQNVGIGTATPNASAKLEITDANRGLLIPRVSIGNVAAAAPVTAPATALLVYNTNAAVIGGTGVGFYYWSGTQWVKLDTGGDWKLLGNASTSAATNFIGTTDAVDFVTRTNNTEKMRVTAAGNVGIGTTAPIYRLTVFNPAAGAYTTYSENNFAGNSDGIGIYGVANNNPGYGFGGYFSGGYMGIRAIATPSTYTGAAYGVYSSISGSAGTRYAGYFASLGSIGTASIAGYFSATGGSTNYAIIVPNGGGFSGFGNTNPNTILEVTSSGTPELRISSTSGFGPARLGLVSDRGSANEWRPAFIESSDNGGFTGRMDFYTNGTGVGNRFGTLRTMSVVNGRVGIGTTFPVSNLNVEDPSIGIVSVYVGRNANATGTVTQIGSIEYFQDQSSTIDFTGGSNFSINLNGAASFNLHLANNSAAKPTSNVWTVFSDKRLKEDVNPFKDGLATLRAINPVYFKYNGKANMPQEYGVGVLAQEIKEVAPYMVGTWQYTDGKLPYEQQKATVETYQSVDNGAMTYIAINAIKELDAKQSKMVETFKNISDFGVVSLTSSEMFVPFSKDFKNQLSATPVVTLTTINSNASLTIVRQTEEGFTVRMNGPFIATSFNWIALAKVKSEALEVNNNYTEAERSAMLQKVKQAEAKINFAREDEALEKRKREKEAIKAFEASIKTVDYSPPVLIEKDPSKRD